MAGQQKYRGVEQSQEIDAAQIRPETRRLGVRAREYFSSTDGVILAMMWMPFIALALIKVPFSGEITALLMWFFYRIYVDPGHVDPKKKGGRRIKYDFPFRVPFIAKVFDGSVADRYQLGEGISYLGKEASSGLEIWTGNSDLRMHMLVLGTTGSGKTEFLLGLVYNALVQNSGFIYTDGKGDLSLFNNVFRLARYIGREDDLVILSFLTSGRDFLGKQADRTTNTTNPFALGSSGMMVELIISLMDGAGGGGDMWKGRAIAFVGGLTKALCFLRDKGYILLDSGKFIEYLELPVIEKLVWDHTITQNGMDVKITDPLFTTVLEPLKSFILTLPGYRRESKGNQEQKTNEQHGFITMQLTRLFGDMSFTYGYIFQTALGEVDMYDVVINRRILVALLPALERSQDSLSMLGKLIVGSIKQMMAGCLGNRIEGAVREIIEARPTNAAVPFYIVLDEYGYYAVPGFAVAPAQARSLGFSITFAAQDFSSLQKASKEEADATWENTNLRIVGRLTSGKESETLRRISGVAGEVQVQEMSRKEYDGGVVMSGYNTIRDTGIVKTARVEWDDLAKQADGEFTFLVGKKEKNGRGGVRVMRARSFYTQVKEKPRYIRVNHFIRVEPPLTGSGDKDMAANDAMSDAISQLIKSGKIKDIFPDDPTAMVRNNQPATLLQVAICLREARSTHKLSLGEAVRVALVCADKEADASGAIAVRKVKVDESSTKEVVSAVDDDVVVVEEQESVDLQAESDLVISASPDGMPENQPVVDEKEKVDETEDGGKADESATGASTTSAKGGASSGGMALTPKQADKEDDGLYEHHAEGTSVVANDIKNFLDFDDTPLPVEARQVSALTFRAIDDVADSQVSQYLESRIGETDILIGAKTDVLEIKSDAQNAVKELEKATTYVKDVKPEPASLPEMDSAIAALLYAAERNSPQDFS